MAVDETMLTLANACGLIIDRTVKPEIVLGQACLISKGRVACCASTIFNYAEAPWALTIRFPHPDLLYSAKSIALHPDFDRKEARTRYLSQTGLPTDAPLDLENDIATITLDPTLPEIELSDLAQINAFLCLSTQITGQDTSGETSGADIASIIERICNSGKEGLLTFFDERRRPIARLSIKQGVMGYVQRSIFKLLTGELALFEMIFRQPRGIFIFQPNTTFNWPNVRDIEVPIEKILIEAKRRAAELPTFINSLGGHDARYVQSGGELNQNAVHPNARWIVERLWTVLDGYLTLDNLWERIGCDTYTALRAIQEMLRLNAIVAEPGSPFHSNGQLGTPVPLLPEAELRPGEQVTGFYIDPISAKPIAIHGAFQGRAGTKQNRLLHNIQFPPGLTGQLVLKSNQLIALSCGPYLPPPERPQPPARLYQMISMHSLGDFGARKLKHTLEMASSNQPIADTAQELGQPAQQRVSSPRIGRYICPACQTLNIESGNCRKCGTDLETGHVSAPIESTHTFLNIPGLPSLTRKHMMIGAAALVALAALAVLISGPKKNALPVPPPVAETPADHNTSRGKNDLTSALEIAAKYAGLKNSLPPGFLFEDASQETNGAKAFAITSKDKNQRHLFVVLDSTQPVDHLELMTVLVPYSDFVQVDEMKFLDNAPLLAKGPSIWGGVTFNWIVARYQKNDGTKQVALIGAYKSPVPGKAIFVLSRPIDGEFLDYKTTLWLIETMAAPLIQQTSLAERTLDNTAGTTSGALPNAKTNEDKELAPQITEATAEELSAYAKTIEDILKLKYHQPKEAGKSSACLIVSITEDGTLSKVELSNPSGIESFDNYLVKLVTANKLPSAPHLKNKSVTLNITASGGKLTVSPE